MVQINFALKEVNCKVVYYGPGLSGKTTNLEVVHNKAPKSNVGELTSIATEGDRTLFFDFLPLNLGQVAGMHTKFQIYTVPGQVYYNSTRKLVLQGADGIVFVADSRRGKMDENIESLRNLEENLKEYGMDIHSLPLVLQYNKRDLEDIHSVEEMQAALNKYDAPYFEAVAVTGEGVFPTLKKLSSMVLEHLNKQHGSARIKTRSAVSVKEPAMATTGGGRGVDPDAPTVRPAPAGGGRVAARQEAGPRPAAGAAGPKVIKEQVAKTPGVKSIERKAPPPAPAVKLRPAAEAAPETAQEAGAGAASRGGKGKKVAVFVVFGVLAAAAAAVYFSGVWQQFLGN